MADQIGKVLHVQRQDLSVTSLATQKRRKITAVVLQSTDTPKNQRKDHSEQACNNQNCNYINQAYEAGLDGFKQNSFDQQPLKKVLSQSGTGFKIQSSALSEQLDTVQDEQLLLQKRRHMLQQLGLSEDIYFQEAFLREHINVNYQQQSDQSIEQEEVGTKQGTASEMQSSKNDKNLKQEVEHSTYVQAHQSWDIGDLLASANFSSLRLAKRQKRAPKKGQVKGQKPTKVLTTTMHTTSQQLSRALNSLHQVSQPYVEDVQLIQNQTHAQESADVYYALAILDACAGPFIATCSVLEPMCQPKGKKGSKRPTKQKQNTESQQRRNSKQFDLEDSRIRPYKLCNISGCILCSSKGKLAPYLQLHPRISLAHPALSCGVKSGVLGTDQVIQILKRLLPGLTITSPTRGKYAKKQSRAEAVQNVAHWVSAQHVLHLSDLSMLRGRAIPRLWSLQRHMPLQRANLMRLAVAAELQHAMSQHTTQPMAHVHEHVASLVRLLGLHLEASSATRTEAIQKLHCSCLATLLAILTPHLIHVQRPPKSQGGDGRQVASRRRPVNSGRARRSNMYNAASLSQIEAAGEVARAFFGVVDALAKVGDEVVQQVARDWQGPEVLGNARVGWEYARGLVDVSGMFGGAGQQSDATEQDASLSLTLPTIHGKHALEHLPPTFLEAGAISQTQVGFSYKERTQHKLPNSTSPPKLAYTYTCTNESLFTRILSALLSHVAHPAPAYGHAREGVRQLQSRVDGEVSVAVPSSAYAHPSLLLGYLLSLQRKLCPPPSKQLPRRQVAGARLEQLRSEEQHQVLGLLDSWLQVDFGSQSGDSLGEQLGGANACAMSALSRFSTLQKGGEQQDNAGSITGGVLQAELGAMPRKLDGMASTQPPQVSLRLVPTTGWQDTYMRHAVPVLLDSFPMLTEQHGGAWACTSLISLRDHLLPDLLAYGRWLWLARLPLLRASIAVEVATQKLHDTDHGALLLALAAAGWEARPGVGVCRGETGWRVGMPASVLRYAELVRQAYAMLFLQAGGVMAWERGAHGASPSTGNNNEIAPSQCVSEWLQLMRDIQQLLESESEPSTSNAASSQERVERKEGSRDLLHELEGVADMDESMAGPLDSGACRWYKGFWHELGALTVGLGRFLVKPGYVRSFLDAQCYEVVLRDQIVANQESKQPLHVSPSPGLMQGAMQGAALTLTTPNSHVINPLVAALADQLSEMSHTHLRTCAAPSPAHFAHAPAPSPATLTLEIDAAEHLVQYVGPYLSGVIHHPGSLVPWQAVLPARAVNQDDLQPIQYFGNTQNMQDSGVGSHLPNVDERMAKCVPAGWEEATVSQSSGGLEAPACDMAVYDEFQSGHEGRCQLRTLLPFGYQHHVVASRNRNTKDCSKQPRLFGEGDILQPCVGESQTLTTNIHQRLHEYWQRYASKALLQPSASLQLMPASFLNFRHPLHLGRNRLDYVLALVDVALKVESRQAGAFGPLTVHLTIDHPCLSSGNVQPPPMQLLRSFLPDLRPILIGGRWALGTCDRAALARIIATLGRHERSLPLAMPKVRALNSALKALGLPHDDAGSAGLVAQVVHACLGPQAPFENLSASLLGEAQLAPASGVGGLAGVEAQRLYFSRLLHEVVTIGSQPAVCSADAPDAAASGKGAPAKVGAGAVSNEQGELGPGGDEQGDLLKFRLLRSLQALQQRGGDVDAVRQEAAFDYDQVFVRLEQGWTGLSGGLAAYLDAWGSLESCGEGEAMLTLTVPSTNPAIYIPILADLLFTLHHTFPAKLSADDSATLEPPPTLASYLAASHEYTATPCPQVRKVVDKRTWSQWAQRAATISLTWQAYPTLTARLALGELHALNAGRGSGRTSVDGQSKGCRSQEQQVAAAQRALAKLQLGEDTGSGSKLVPIDTQVAGGDVHEATVTACAQRERVGHPRQEHPAAIPGMFSLQQCGFKSYKVQRFLRYHHFDTSATPTFNADVSAPSPSTLVLVLALCMHPRLRAPSSRMIRFNLQHLAACSCDFSRKMRAPQTKDAQKAPVVVAWEANHLVRLAHLQSQAERVARAEAASADNDEPYVQLRLKIRGRGLQGSQGKGLGAASPAQLVVHINYLATSTNKWNQNQRKPLRMQEDEQQLFRGRDELRLLFGGQVRNVKAEGQRNDAIVASDTRFAWILLPWLLSRPRALQLSPTQLHAFVLLWALTRTLHTPPGLHTPNAQQRTTARSKPSRPAATSQQQSRHKAHAPSAGQHEGSAASPAAAATQRLPSATGADQTTQAHTEQLEVNALLPVQLVSQGVQLTKRGGENVGGYSLTEWATPEALALHSIWQHAEQRMRRIVAFVLLAWRGCTQGQEGPVSTMLTHYQTEIVEEACGKVLTWRRLGYNTQSWAQWMPSGGSGKALGSGTGSFEEQRQIQAGGRQRSHALQSDTNGKLECNQQAIYLEPTSKAVAKANMVQRQALGSGASYAESDELAQLGPQHTGAAGEEQNDEDHYAYRKRSCRFLPGYTSIGHVPEVGNVEMLAQYADMFNDYAAQSGVEVDVSDLEGEIEEWMQFARGLMPR